MATACLRVHVWSRIHPSIPPWVGIEQSPAPLRSLPTRPGPALAPAGCACWAAGLHVRRYEPPYFDRGALPYPPLALRLALACGQMMVYHERFPMSSK